MTAPSSKQQIRRRPPGLIPNPSGATVEIRRATGRELELVLHRALTRVEIVGVIGPLSVVDPRGHLFYVRV